MVPNIVKPRLDLSAEDEVTPSGIPANYTLNIRVTGDADRPEYGSEIDAIDAALMSNGLLETFLTSAINSIYSRDTTNRAAAASSVNESTANTLP